jgi:hypothetical protein
VDNVDNEIVEIVEGLSKKVIPLPYVEPSCVNANAALLSDETVEVEVDEKDSVGVSVIFEQVMRMTDAGREPHPEDKAMLVLPEQALGSDYIAPSINGGMAMVQHIEEEDSGVIQVKEPAGADALSLTFNKIPEDKIFQYNLADLTGLGGAVVHADANKLAVQVATGTQGIDMVQNSQSLGAEYVVGPGRYMVCGVQEGSTFILVDDDLRAVAAGPGRCSEISETDGRHVIGKADAQVQAANKPLLVLQEIGNDWVALPSYNQFIKAREFIRLVPLLGLNSKVRIVGE